MSADLFVTRISPTLSWPQVREALDSFCASAPGLSCFIVDGDVEADNVYAWNVQRAAVSLEMPEAGDVADYQVEALCKPHVVVSAASSQWSWVELVAFELATRLGGELYDPQESGAYAAHGPVATLADLKVLHDKTLAEHPAHLVTAHWASVPPAVRDGDEIARHAEVAIEAASAVGLEPLGASQPTADQVDWRGAFRSSSGFELRVSSQRDWAPPGAVAGRHICIQGAAADGIALDCLVDAFRALGMTFRTVTEYQPSSTPHVAQP